MQTDRYFLESLVFKWTELLQKVPSFGRIFSLSKSQKMNPLNKLNRLTLAQLMLITWKECMLTPLKPFWRQAINNMRQGFNGKDSHDDSVLPGDMSGGINIEIEQYIET